MIINKTSTDQCEEGTGMGETFQFLLKKQTHEYVFMRCYAGTFLQHGKCQAARACVVGKEGVHKHA